MNTRRFPLDVKSRYFDPKPKSHRLAHHITGRNLSSIHTQKHSPNHSIFSKPVIFELPIRRTHNILHQNHVKYMKDVVQRKDFSEAQKLVSKYLENKRSIPFDDEKITKRGSFTGKMFLNSSNQSTTINASLQKDTKLMNLLDELELEVKNNNFNENNKQLFDTKIRKIYSSLVGKTDIFEHSNMLGFNDSDIVTKYDKILNNTRLSGIQENFNMNERNKQSPIENKNLNYRNIKYLNDTDNINNDEGEKQMTSNRNYALREDLLNSNYYDNEESFPLAVDRKRFYENKLKSLQRRIKYLKGNGYKYGGSEDRRLRFLRPTKATAEYPFKKPKEPINAFYMPDRARFLHGF